MLTCVAIKSGMRGMPLEGFGGERRSKNRDFTGRRKKFALIIQFVMIYRNDRVGVGLGAEIDLGPCRVGGAGRKRHAGRRADRLEIWRLGLRPHGPGSEDQAGRRFFSLRQRGLDRAYANSSRQTRCEPASARERSG